MIAPLFAQAADATRTTFELVRLQDYTERWHYLVLALASALVVAFVIYMYRRDSVELPRGVGVLLAALRLVALLGVLAYYLDLEKRSQTKLVHHSRVVVAVDTSLSMGLHDSDSSPVPAVPNRLQQAVSLLVDEKFVEDVRKRHDVTVMRFDSEPSRVAQLPRAAGSGAAEANGSRSTAGLSTVNVAGKSDWAQRLSPQGAESKLGQALRQVLHDERSAPLAGIVVLTDGGQNAGLDPASAVALARELKVPIYTVGYGSDRRPANVRVSDFVAPARAYPGDSFTVTGYLQAQQLDGRTVAVELSSRAAGTAPGTGETLEDSQRVTLPTGGEVVPVKFEITPDDKGRRTFRLRVKAPSEDTTAADDQQEADVEIVDRKTRVLLAASGPTREYIYLRNQLRRDKEFIVDVWLQTGQPGISQDADKILDDFPATPQELFEYDAIVGFDTDWRELDASQVDLLERWVGEKAGGLLVLAGPVETDSWVRDPKLSKLRALYPVEFNTRLAGLEDSRYGSDTPWPVQFTREGLEAEFLWLADSAPKNEQAWTGFPGVYGYFDVRGAKSGATVYARYSNPESGSQGELPVYMAEQFYGAGRVFYLGSGEMWRLRALDDSYFEQFYTKLIRHVSQGRLLAGSSRGMLLVDRDRYVLGNTVVVRAQLSNAQFEPLDLPRVPLEIVRPDSVVDTLPLQADPTRKGMYGGQFTVLQEGAYRLELAVPEAGDEQLSRRLQVKVPDLEREEPQRNDALLSDIAKSTGGIYYVGTDAALGRKGLPALAGQLKDRTEVTYLAGVPDMEFEQRWMQALLWVVAGALLLEWLIRRFFKLA